MLWVREILRAKEMPSNSLHCKICLTEALNYYSNNTETV